MDSPSQQYKERFFTTPRRYRERTVSPVRRYGRVVSPPLPSCRDRHKGSFSQQTAVRGALLRMFGMQVDRRKPSTPQNLGNDAMSKALQQISHSPFSEEKESTNLPEDLLSPSLSTIMASLTLLTMSIAITKA